ncbi:MAG: hypothetical protein AB8F34_04045 [Akkermansiaceae bacterium]
MKNFAIISLVLGFVALGFGLYCQFEVVPSAEAADRMSEGMSIDDPRYPAVRSLVMEKYDQKSLFGQVALFAGGLGVLGGVFAGIKKAKLGFIAAAVSLPALILGLLQATHMFS